MKFNFRKIASVLASVVMLGSTIGIAAAANYPAPFVSGGVADVAVVYGSDALVSDSIQAGLLSTDLQVALAKQTATTTTTVVAGSCSGECAPAFTGSSKLYVNDSLNAVKNTMTKTELPVLLKDGSFSGNVDSTYTQRIDLGSSPRLVFAKQPTSSDDPVFGYALSTTAASYIYNTTVTFNRAVNFTHVDSKNQQLTILGQTFTVGSATDASNLVLLKEASKLNFDSSGTTSQEVTVAGKKYTVELVSASTSAATVKVTDEAGASEQKEVSEGFSKKINGLTVAVNTADSNNLKYTASLVAGAEKYTLTDGSSVTYGDSGTVIDGTTVDWDSATTGAITRLVIEVYAASSDKDSIKPGQAFVDPVLGTFKVDFAGLNIDENSSTRATQKFYGSGSDKLLADLTDINGNVKTGVQYVYNASSGILLTPDTDGHNYVVAERAAANKSDYIMVGNEDEGHLIKVTQIVNQSTTGLYDQDKVEFVDVFDPNGAAIAATLTGEGSGTVTIGGKVYDLAYYGTSTASQDTRQVRLNYPDSTSSTADMIIYPVISMAKGLKLGFYKPLTISLTNWDVANATCQFGCVAGSTVSKIKVPNGAKGYEDISIVAGTAAGGLGNFSVNGVNLNNVGDNTTVTLTSTGLNVSFYSSAANATKVYLASPAGGIITNPGVFMYEEKDDNNAYQNLFVTTEGTGTSTNKLGVSDVVRSWNNGVTTGAAQFRDNLASNSKLVKEADLWGSVVTIDQSDTDQYSATISYPDDQVYAQVYVAANAATVTPGTSSGGGNVVELGDVLVKDSELSQVATKNLVVVGGSCVNTVAAKILGSNTKMCGAAFTTASGVGASQALVKVVDAATAGGTAGKVAMLIAGFEAADTTKAVKYVMTEKPSTSTNTTQKLSTSAAVATIVS